MDTLAGLRKRSKSREYFSGSISVIHDKNARSAHAADHLHGHTGIQWSFAQFMKSATIMKYQLNHIRSTTTSSYSILSIIFFWSSRSFSTNVIFSFEKNALDNSCSSSADICESFFSVFSISSLLTSRNSSSSLNQYSYRLLSHSMQRYLRYHCSSSISRSSFLHLKCSLYFACSSFASSQSSDLGISVCQ